MRTLLSQFCEDFDGVLRPLLEPLQAAERALSAAAPAPAGARPTGLRAIPASTGRFDGAAGGGPRGETGGETGGVTGAQTGARAATSPEAILPELRDLTHRLRVLADKVAEQQAYVLIFGPLKSGKSTLMNAVSAAYVSEVTSLPAYPCMVFVSHADERGYTLTKYNGKAEDFADPAAMRMQVGRAHTELARRIREVEESGERFDPAVHYPEAIRRVDVKVPADNLRESGAVLVDTPGLYSRMKFGYDRMTREFRSTAACAIFCVKSDNLFLEQVFQEFHELLELFSRIFLVVNLDTTKQDLRPDGSLAPSLEHDDPIRIIEAFENLAMSAPLKAAAEEGRLQIYPVDLLRAASKRLRGEATSEESYLIGQADFDAFLGDLTDYLNSTDYLVAFLGDSLRHAKTLCEEVLALCEHDSLQALERRVADLQAQEARAKTRAEVLGRLRAFGWQQCIDRFQEGLLDASAPDVAGIRRKTQTALRGALEEWFDTDHSLADLCEKDLTPLHEGCNAELEQTLLAALGRRIESAEAGLELPSTVRADLLAAGLRLEPFARTALSQVDVANTGRTEPVVLDSTTVPVQKSLVDWLLFRSRTRVNKSLFGPPDRPAKPIPRATKARRLGAESRQVVGQAIDDHLATAVQRRMKQLTRFVFGDYGSALRAAVAAELETQETANAELKADLARRLAEEGRVLERLRALRGATEEARESVEDLSLRYGETEPEKLIQPLPTPEEGRTAGQVLDARRKAAKAEASESSERDPVPATDELELE